MSREAPRVASLLLVEDNPSDVALFREALATSGVSLAIASVWNGQQALDYLRRQGEFAAAPRPDVLVLDVNLPVLGGREVLAEMAADGDLNTIPVVILAGSREEGGVREIDTPGRCFFAAKPRHFSELVELVRSVARFAGSAAGPPGEGPAA